jgi:hypothetical protein
MVLLKNKITKISKKKSLKIRCDTLRALWFFTKDPKDSLNPSHSFEVENLGGRGGGSNYVSTST